jgi:hypothetical protein
MDKLKIASNSSPVARGEDVGWEDVGWMDPSYINRHRDTLRLTFLLTDGYFLSPISKQLNPFSVKKFITHYI